MKRIHHYHHLKTIILSVVLTLSVFPAKAYKNVFYGGTGNDRFTTACTTKDGGYIVGGWSESNGAGGKDAWVQKYDKDSKLQWERFYGGPGDEVLVQLVQDADGSYLFCGSTTSKGGGGKDAWLVKLSKSGKLLWDKTIGGARDDEAVSLSLQAEGLYSPRAYCVAINTRSKGKGDRDVQTCFFSLKGELLRELLISTPGEDWACASQPGRYGIEIAGSSQGQDSVRNWILNMNMEYASMDKLKPLPYRFPLQKVFFPYLCIGDEPVKNKGVRTNFTMLTELDSTGKEDWSTYSLDGRWEVTGFLNEYYGGPYILACSNGPERKEEAFLYTLSPKGDVLGSFGPDEANPPIRSGFSSVLQLKNKSFLGIGYWQNASTTHTDGWMCTLTGNELYDYRTFGHAQEGLKIKAHPDGGFVVLGDNSTTSSEISRFDAKGRLLWSRTIGAQIFRGSEFTGLLVLPEGTIVASGTDSILGFRPDGTKAFGIGRQDALAALLPSEGNTFLEVKASGTTRFDSQGRIVAEKAFKSCSFSSFRINRIDCLKDGSFLFLGYTPGDGMRSTADGFTMFNELPKAICLDANGKLRWEYREENIAGQFHFVSERTDGTLVLFGRCATIEKQSSMIMQTLRREDGRPADNYLIVSKTGFPKQMLTMSDSSFVLVVHHKKLVNVMPFTEKIRNVEFPAGHEINDIDLLPDGNYLVTGEIEVSYPNGRRMLVAKVDKYFDLIPF